MVSREASQGGTRSRFSWSLSSCERRWDESRSAGSCAPLAGLPLAVLASALLTALFSPVLVVPLALVDTMTGADRRRIELGRS
jgi:hypothetical protein